MISASGSAPATFDLPEILIIAAVALIIIGPERMPEVIRALARLMRELRSASNQVIRELSEAIEEPVPPAIDPARPPSDAVRESAATAEPPPQT